MKKQVTTMWICVLGMVLGASAVSWAAPLGTAFTYQGRLTDQGNPANGAYDFIFRMYNALSGGVQVGGAIQYDDISVTDGYFTELLDFEINFEGEARWLDIQVRPGNSTEAYTLLTPRQELAPTPNALYAKVAGSVITGGSGFWTDSGNDIYNTNSGNVGIGTNTPMEKLEVDGSLRVQRTGGEYGVKITRAGPTETTISSGLYVDHQGHAGQSGKYAHGVQTRVVDENSGALAFSGISQSANGDAYGFSLDVTSGGGNYCRGIEVDTHDTNSSGGWAFGILSLTDSVSGGATGAYISADVGTNSTSEVRGVVSHATHNDASGDSFGIFTSGSGSRTGDAYGLYADVAKWDTHTDGTSYAGYFSGRSYRLGGDSYGLYTRGSSNGGTSYGIYAEAFGGSTNWAGYFAGDVRITGNTKIDGRVGIGTTSPQQLLHVYGTSNPRILVEAPVTASPEINLKRGTQGWGFWMDSDNDLNFFNNGNKVTFASGGNVGIGTSSPASKLHVSGGSVLLDYDSGITLKDGNGFYSGHLFMRDTDSLQLYNSAAGGEIAFWTSQTPGVVTQQAVITGNGDVGIGTISPAYKLDVGGPVNLNKGGVGTPQTILQTPLFRGLDKRGFRHPVNYPYGFFTHLDLLH